MSAKSRRKGDSFELEAAKLFRAAGYSCVKTGAYKPDDLHVALGTHDLVVECKRRKRGFAGLYGFLERADAVVHRDDFKPALITMPLETFFQLRGGQ